MFATSHGNRRKRSRNGAHPGGESDAALRGIDKRVPPVEIRERLLWTLFELQLFFIGTFSASFFRQMDVRLAVIIRLLRCLRLFRILGLFRVLRILIFRFRTLG